MYKTKRILLIFTLMLLSLTVVYPSRTEAATTPKGDILTNRCLRLSGTHNVYERIFTIVLPNRGVTAPLPLMMNIHGANMNAAWQEVTTGTGDAARNGHFIAVFPQAQEARNRIWDINRNSADMNFLVSIIQYMKNSGCVNPNRIYVTGFSQGGMLTSQLACYYPNLITRAAPVGGVIPTYNCVKGKAIPVMAVHGDEDPLVYYNGHLSSVVKKFTNPIYDVNYSRLKMIENWGVRNGCASKVTKIKYNANVTRVTYNCVSVQPKFAVMYTVTKGTHSWPGSPWNIPGEPYFDTTGVVLNFFGLK